MELKRRTVVAMVGAGAVAGCLGVEDGTPQPDGTGGDGDGGEDADDGGSGDATVRVRSHPEFGEILVGPDGMTLYSFDMDTQDVAESTCYDDCAEAWPPLTVEATPEAGADVAAELTTFEREDGAMQVAANGWPLYYFANDEEPGDASGQGVNDVWWVLGADGAPIRPDAGGGESGGGAGDGNGGGPNGVY